MRLVFATTQTLSGSTMLGRVLPLAKRLGGKHEVHILALGAIPVAPLPLGVSVHGVGREPFIRTPSGKQREHGLQLTITMLGTALMTAWHLWRLAPHRVVIVKPLPANVLGVYLWSWFQGTRKIILDADDFELTANVTSSLLQRAAIHWAERTAAKVADAITCATPFLADHFQQLTNHERTVTRIPTGLDTLPPLHRELRLGETPVLAYFGSLSVTSGHPVDMLPDILTAVRTYLPSARLIIAGEGDSTQKLREKFSKQGLAECVTWYGRFQLQDLPIILSDCTTVLDPVGATITERAKSSFRSAWAAAAGLPVITSNIGIRPYLIPTSLHARLFAQPADAADYAVKIRDVHHQPLSLKEQHDLRTQGERFGWDALLGDFQALLT